MSNLVEFAETELARLDMGAETADPMNKLMHDNIIEIVKKFGEQGHSGFSASYALGLLTKLLDYDPLSPLTGEDDEWIKHDKSMGDWQNKRCFNVFKDPETGKAYDSNGRVFKGPDGDSFTNGDSRVEITFPYYPSVEYVEVDADHKPVPKPEPAVDENTSDGFHTFKELYDHRIALFIKLMQSHPDLSWRSTKHSDGSMFDGWFIAGMNLPTGMITYHLPSSDWSKLDGITELDRGPEWDGHTPADVVDRLTKWRVGK